MPDCKPLIAQVQQIFIKKSLPCLHLNRIHAYLKFCSTLIKFIIYNRSSASLDPMEEILGSLLAHFKTAEVDAVQRGYLKLI